MDRDSVEDQEPSEGPVSDDEVLDIGTEPVGETDIVNVGTDVVIGSEFPRDDAIRLIGTEYVGKAERPSDAGEVRETDS